ncbi:hypothetical protein EDB86DRAFT_2980963 [Lactarius hatsudake]|nr:hypothetical protein EDB86DRAFT_2980963 [Lactarius hatsudake]
MTCSQENADAVDIENDIFSRTLPPQESDYFTAGAVTTSLRRRAKATPFREPRGPDREALDLNGSLLQAENVCAGLSREQAGADRIDGPALYLGCGPVVIPCDRRAGRPASLLGNIRRSAESEYTWPVRSAPSLRREPRRWSSRIGSWRSRRLRRVVSPAMREDECELAAAVGRRFARREARQQVKGREAQDGRLPCFAKDVARQSQKNFSMGRDLQLLRSLLSVVKSAWETNMCNPLPDSCAFLELHGNSLGNRGPVGRVVCGMGCRDERLA